MKKSLWGGRFEAEVSKMYLEFASSENLKVDEKLVEYDVKGSVAHAVMLAEQKIITGAEAKAIVNGLRQVELEWKKGVFKLSLEDEDVHLNVERRLTEKVGEPAKKLHTARSRNDQVNLDMRLYLRDKALALEKELIATANAFLSIAKNTRGLILPGYTHTRVAQPINAAFWAHAHAEALIRCAQRVRDAYPRLNSNPLGACALAGTTWPINRKLTAELLGFESVQENALDVVTSRGEFEAELAAVCALAMTRLSVIATDLIMYSMPELGFVDLPEAFCTGSSIMPQKKNPDALEILRGRASRVLANLNALLSIQKGVPSGHNGDTQETKKLAMETLDTTIGCLKVMAEMAKGLEFDSEKSIFACEKSYAAATDLADLLARKGIPFRQAHEIAGGLVKEAVKENGRLSSFSVTEVTRAVNREVKGKFALTEEELSSALDIPECVRARKNGPAPDNVKRMAEESGKKLATLEAGLKARVLALNKADDALAKKAGSLR